MTALRAASRAPARILAALAIAITALAGHAAHAAPADRARIEVFLDVTGFDVALDSIALSASSAPEMLGLEAGDYGAQWRRVSREVFDTAQMRATAIDLLEPTLTAELLDHGIAFYDTALGRQLVAAENASHMDDSLGKEAVGEQMVADMVEQGDARLEILQRMNRAIDPDDVGLRAVQEIQIRFLLAAAGSGVVELQRDEADMRAAMQAQEDELRVALEISGLANAAFTYRDFSEDELVTYAEALEHPDMTRLYQLMNTVQYEIMANRFETLAGRMAELRPMEEL